MAVKSKNTLRAKVNKDFIIKWSYFGETDTHLIGAGQYHKKFGVDLRDRHFKEIFKKGLQVYIYKIRRKYIIKFISK